MGGILGASCWGSPGRGGDVWGSLVLGGIRGCCVWGGVVWGSPALGGFRGCWVLGGSLGVPSWRGICQPLVLGFLSFGGL